MGFQIDFKESKVTASLIIVFTICASLSIIISLVHLGMHLKRYTVPHQQRCIVRIILMVPMYSIWSLLSLFFYKYQAYFGMIRDAYEAYALYMFFSLMLDYGGGWDRLAGTFSDHPPVKAFWPFRCLIKPSKRLLVFCRQGILQYTLVKPLVSLTCALCLYFGYYEEGDWSPKHNIYLYATIINNICVSVSLYFLALFYQIAKEELKPYSPLLKFACIKMIVFFCYWQSVVIAVIVSFKVIPKIDGYTGSEAATSIQNGLICTEMLVFSVLHMIAFPSGMYSMRAYSQKPLVRESDMEGGVLKGVKDVTSQKDIMVDTYHSFVPKNIRNTIAKHTNKNGSKSNSPEIPMHSDNQGQVELDEFAIFTKPKIDRKGLLTDDFVQDAFKNLKQGNDQNSRSMSQNDEDDHPDDNEEINISRR